MPNKLEMQKGLKTIYLATFNEIPNIAKADAAQKKLIIDSTRNSLEKALKGKLLSEKNIKAGDVTGREFQVESAAVGIYRTRVFLHGNRLYQFVVTGDKSVVTGKDAETFFKSIKFMK